MARRLRPNQRSAVLGTVKDEPPAAVAQGAILDSACARRSASSQVGTKEWPSDRTKEWDFKKE
jgi:hypothetical protein